MIITKLIITINKLKKTFGFVPVMFKEVMRHKSVLYRCKVPISVH